MSKKATLAELDGEDNTSTVDLAHIKEIKFAKEVLNKSGNNKKRSVNTMILDASNLKSEKATERIQFLLTPDLLNTIATKAGIKKKDINKYLKQYIEMSFKNEDE